uniref:CS domain-containing protein n=1 Tax=Glossina austeni TaxID=7395 RepID=A0A1A9V1E2_GLOAU
MTFDSCSLNEYPDLPITPEEASAITKALDVLQEVLKDTYYLPINFAAEIHGEENILILDLFGVVTPKLVSHELRGLNVVIVRLVKSVHITWPRLLKYPWLSYNYNFIDVREIDGVNPTPLNYKVASDEITDSESDSEQDLFHTYNRTEKCEDDADPFS